MSTESMPVHCIEIEMASKTPKEDGDEDDFSTTKVNLLDHRLPTGLPEKQVDVILTMVTRLDGVYDDELRCRQAFIKQQLERHETGTASDTDYFIQFVTKSSHYLTILNQVSRHRDFTVILAQPKDFDIQRWTTSSTSSTSSATANSRLTMWTWKAVFSKNCLKPITDLK